MNAARATVTKRAKPDLFSMAFGYIKERYDN